MADKFQDMAGRFKGGGPKGLGLGVKLLVGAAAGAYGIAQSMYTVDGGHRAIIFSRIGGIQPDIYSEGLHFRIPWFQYPIVYDIRSRPRKMASPTGSKDLQMCNIGLRVLSRPDMLQIPLIHRELGQDFDEKVRLWRLILSRNGLSSCLDHDFTTIFLTNSTHFRSCRPSATRF